MAEDLAGRVVEQQVEFNVARLEIVSPRNDEKIITQSAELPFEYAAEGNFSTISYAIDNGPQQLITQAPGTQIPIQIAPGNHEIRLRGDVADSRTTQRARFDIGSVNLTAETDGINYQYQNCNTEFTECDVEVTLTVTNSGDFNVDQTVNLRLQHLGRESSLVLNQSIATLAVDTKASVSLPAFRARLGDTLTLTVDPDGEITGEWPNDNIHQIQFEAGQITNLSFELPEDNAYIENVSVLEYIQVDTAGPIASVEYRVGDWVFVDNVASDGFASIVDMGLLSATNNCLYVVAYGTNQQPLDTQRQCFTIKQLNLEQISPMQLQWSLFSSGDNRVNTSNIDRRRLATDLAQARAASLVQDVAVIPTLQENERVVYRVLTNAAGAEGRPISQNSGLTGAPIVGSSIPLPNGHGTFITTLDPTHDVCSVDAAIPIFTQARSLEVSELLSEELDQINDMFNLNLDSTQEFLRITLASVGLPIYYRVSLDELDDSFSDLDFAGLSYLGWIWADIPSQVARIDVRGEIVYGFNSEGCFVREEDGDLELVFSGSYEYGIKDASFNLSTGGFSLSTLGLLSIDILSIPVLPIAIIDADFKIYPQNLVVPMELSTKVSVAAIDNQLFFGPAQARLSYDHFWCMTKQ